MTKLRMVLVGLGRGMFYIFLVNVSMSALQSISRK